MKKPWVGFVMSRLKLRWMISDNVYMRAYYVVSPVNTCAAQNKIILSLTDAFTQCIGSIFESGFANWTVLTRVCTLLVTEFPFTTSHTLGFIDIRFKAFATCNCKHSDNSVNVLQLTVLKEIKDLSVVIQPNYFFFVKGNNTYMLTDRTYPSVNAMVISICSPVRFNPDQLWRILVHLSWLIMLKKANFRWFILYRLNIALRRR